MTNSQPTLSALRRTGLAALVTAFAWALPAAAQVAIEAQPDPTAWYHTALEKRAAGLLDEKHLLALKPGKIPAALRTDLTTFDWLLVGSYSYPDKETGVSYREANPSQLNLLRLLPDGSEQRFSYVAKATDPEHGQIVHTNFIQPPPVKTRVRDLNGETYLETLAYGESELHRVVSYRNGVLVVDISFDGKPRSRQVKFREVRIAIPRGFAWKPAAK